ncbi:hypothetical protein BDD14_5486 [Edaphobacter modestus]|uniref:Uncharacterized protein n=1 Tax=Edaphobacter modestus TaxID=388466 RepID=A0A4Q7YEM9_9BACT|nr:hypothetical protein BDD14_5486 [Edaphobacter modestus]
MGDAGSIGVFQETVGRVGQPYRSKLSIVTPFPRPSNTLGSLSIMLETLYKSSKPDVSIWEGEYHCAGLNTSMMKAWDSPTR